MNSAWSAILNASLLSAPLAVAVWLALRFTPRHALNAATRYLVWWILLAVVIAMPCLFRPARGVLHPSSSVEKPPAGILHALDIPPGMGRARQPGHSSMGLRFPLEIPPGAWLTWLLAAWMLSSAALLFRLLLSYRAVRRAAAGASEAPPELWQHVREWPPMAGAFRHGLRIANSASVPIPVAAGPFRPAILLPAAILRQMDKDEIEPIVLHEAAHLARKDDWALLLERLMEAVLALHPVVRWITRQIDLEREIACDDLVVESTGRPHHYAQCLTRAMALCGAAPGALAAAHAGGNRSHISRRVELLVDPTRDTRTGLLAARFSVFAAALVGAAFALASAPGPLTFATEPKEIAMKSNTPRKLVLAAAAAAAMAAQPARPQTPAAQAQVQKYAGQRLLALFFDSNTLTQADQDRAVAAATKFVQTQLKPADRAAVIVSYGGALTVRQDFTSDRDALLKAIQQVGALPASGVSAALPSDETARIENDRRLAHLQSVVQMLGALSEKKSLIYFASGMTRTATDNQAQLQATIEAAVKANVAFYPIDVSGLPAK